MATKAPWPLVDGGRLLLWNTLRALHAEGARVTLVAPHSGTPAEQTADEAQLRKVCHPVLVPSRTGLRGIQWFAAEWKRRPWTIERHDKAAVRQRVIRELENRGYRVVVAEQVQALAQIPGALRSGEPMPPVVLRAQNVESDLWRVLSRDASLPAPFRWWLGRQARSLAAYEGTAVDRCRATAALTGHDAESLRKLARPKLVETAEAAETAETAEACIDVIPAAFDIELPPGPALEGEPAIVLFGSSGWKPNLDGARDFVGGSWAEIRRRHPGAVLHVFGALGLGESSEARDGIRHHPAPAESATALASGSVLVVPLSVASGVRMKILEAWARGIAVVASPVAAGGLVAETGRELLIADQPADWAGAVSRAVECYAELTASARSRLAATYSLHAVARAWLQLFEDLEGAAGDAQQTS